MSTKKKTKAKATDKTAKAVDPKAPTLTSILAVAGQAYGKYMQNYLVFCEQYVLATSLYGSVGKKSFHEKWAYFTPAMWSHAEAIGKHILLPQFAIASDSMIAGILRLKDSMSKQLVLVGAMKDGKIETIQAGGKIVLKSLDQLSKLEELGVVFAMNQATSHDEIKKFAFMLRQQWLLNAKSAKPDFEKVGDNLRINHAIKIVSRKDWSAMGVMMGWI